MAENSGKPDYMRAYLKRLGNPYASLQVVDDAGQKDASIISNDPQRPYVRHPYAYASMEADSDTAESDVTSCAISKHPAKVVLTKAEFRARCRRIFEQYIPAIEKGRLRRYHRDFITRNESRTPTTRYLLVSELQKYDLSTIPGLKAHFNRETESLTEAKLKQIERLFDSEK